MDASTTTASPASFRDVIDLWKARTCVSCGSKLGAREAMGADIGAPPSAISKWWQRDNIPAEYWQGIVDSETGKTGGVTTDVLTELASRRVGVRDLAEARP